MDKTLQKHLDAIQSGTVDRTNVIGLRRAINKAEHQVRGYWTSRMEPKAKPSEVWEVESWLEREQPRVSGDLRTSGLAVLRNPRYARRLAPVQDIIDCLDHFELVRFDRLAPNGSGALPCYRAVGAHGRSFTFRNVPWQSGGDGPTVLTIQGVPC